jgi:16S rRNA (cytosine1402-N4)-methyltransferase
MTRWKHIPILAQRVAELLVTGGEGVYLDGTLGLGGHTLALLGALGAGAKIIGLDKDLNAVKIARENVADARLSAFQASYLEAPAILKELSIPAVDGALFDLGLSSYQLDDASRGFSFMREGPLDMRFDNTKGESAADIVNNWPAEKIAVALEKCGGERAANKIALAIYEARRAGPISTTTGLAKIVENVLPRFGKTHPATKTFQALRIVVNDELGSVERLPGLLVDIIKPGGRAAFLTFHSTEDRIIKQGLKSLVSSAAWRLVNKKIIEPSYREVKQNPRARSAKLRVIERLK